MRPKTTGLGLIHTSRVGTGLSRLFSHFTEIPIAEKKNCEAATSNNPELSFRNDDSAVRHRSEIVCWCVCVRLGFNRGNTSSGMGGPSPLAGESESDEIRVAG
jgi:hypothetical protein